MTDERVVRVNPDGSTTISHPYRGIGLIYPAPEADGCYWALISILMHADIEGAGHPIECAGHPIVFVYGKN